MTKRLPLVRSDRRLPRVAVRRSGIATFAIIAGFTMFGGVSAFSQTVTGLTCVPQTVIAPGTATCTVTISQNASPGFYVNILSANGDAATPTSISIPTGSPTGTFTVTVGNIANDEQSDIAAYINLSTQIFQLAMTSQLQATGVTCAASSLAAGQSTTCTVTINKVSGSASTINLSSSTPYLTVPSTVTIPAGAVTGNFTVSASAVPSYQSATITAQWNATVTSTVTTVIGLGATATGKLIVGGVTDAADNWSTNTCSPGSWRTVSGGGFTSLPAQSSSPTTTLGGVQVTVNGTAAPLTFASPSMITFQCPVLAAGTPLQVVIVASGGSGSVPIQSEIAASPSIFVVDSARDDQGLVLLANTGTLAMPQTPGVASAPANKGGYVSIFATGLGVFSGSNPAMATNSVRVWIGGFAVTPSFVGAAQATNGVFQVIAQIPATVQSGIAVPLYLELDLSSGAVLPSNQVMIAVN